MLFFSLTVMQVLFFSLTVTQATVTQEKVCVPKIGFRKAGVPFCVVFLFERSNRDAGDRDARKSVCTYNWVSEAQFANLQGSSHRTEPTVTQ